MNASFQSVALETVDESFDGFSISWPDRSPRLERSIRAVGLLQPPLVIERQGRYIAVCGLRRIRTLKRLGAVEAACRLLRDAALGDEELLVLNAEDNHTTREVSLFEKARLVGHINRLSPEGGERVWRRLASSVLAETGRTERERLLRLDALPEVVKAFAAGRRLPPRHALQLSLFSSRDAVALVELAEEYSLTAAQTGELAESLREIIARDQCGFEAAVAKIEKGLVEGELPAQRVRERLMERLRGLRFPRWQAARTTVDDCLNRINGTPGVTVRPPPNFEGGVFRAEVNFRSPEELVQRARALERFAASDAARTAFELL